MWARSRLSVSSDDSNTESRHKPAMVTVWRIAKTRYAATAFDGEGARLNGGRWNSVGLRVGYASETVALATLEVLVGLQKSSVLGSYSTVSAQIDEARIETLPRSVL